MIKKPNAFQKFLHRFIMLRVVTSFFADKTHIIDGAILKLTKGKHSLSEYLGWNIVQINTVGAKTGKLHQIVLLALIDGDKIGIIASNFGRKPNPGWYYNLVKTPVCDVQLNGLWAKYAAREIQGEEYKKYWNMAVSSYKGYEKYKQRASHRHIPLMLLEPARDYLK
jgi:deazaflavin-dependent oxidoreductase (nitroreductase family)